MPGPFELKLSRYFITAKISVGTESKTVFMKLKSFKWMSNFKHVFTGSYPYCGLFDDKFPDKCEPYAQTIEFTCINDRGFCLF